MSEFKFLSINKLSEKFKEGNIIKEEFNKIKKIILKNIYLKYNNEYTVIKNKFVTVVTYDYHIKNKDKYYSYIRSFIENNSDFTVKFYRDDNSNRFKSLNSTVLYIFPIYDEYINEVKTDIKYNYVNVETEYAKFPTIKELINSKKQTVTEKINDELDKSRQTIYSMYDNIDILEIGYVSYAFNYDDNDKQEEIEKFLLDCKTYMEKNSEYGLKIYKQNIHRYLVVCYIKGRECNFNNYMKATELFNESIII